MRKPLAVLFVALSGLAFGWIALRTFRSFDPAVHFANPSLFLVALGFQIANLVSQFWVWRKLLRAQDVRTGGADLYRSYALGALGRYLPVGKAVQLGAILVTSAARDRVNSLVTFVEWTLAGLLSGSFLMCLAGFLVDARLAGFLFAGWSAVALLVFAPDWERRRPPEWAFRALRRLGKDGFERERFAVSRRRILFASVAMLLTSWLAESLAALALFATSHGAPSLVEAATVTFSDALSYFGGLLAFVAPSGLGVRESLFYWISEGRLDAFDAGFIPLALRGTWFIAEFLFFVPLLFVRGSAAVERDAEAKAEIERLYRIWTEEDGYPRFGDDEYRDILVHSELLRTPGKRVLDVGCGVGRVAVHLKRLGHRVDGIDLVADCVEVAVREKRIDRGFAVDAKRTGLPDGSYDVVLCFGVLLHVFELREFFAEVSRLLKPGGEVIVFDHNAASPYAKLHFNRPDWIDRFLEGRSNAPRRPLSEALVRESDASGIRWGTADYLSVYTRHPNWKIDFVHDVARVLFRVVRAFTRAPWTGNMLVLVGKKGGG